MKPFLLNPARMSFRMADVLGGILLCGKKGEGRFFGNGDCILLDGATGLIAVADGTERTPEASRRFLSLMADQMQEGQRTGGEMGLHHFVEAAKGVLEQFRYEDRTTFVCLLPAHDGSMLYVSGGDSVLMQLDADAGEVVFRNRSNMGFTGRYREVADFGQLMTKKGDRFLLASDGLWDLAVEDGQDAAQLLLRGLKTDPVHFLPDRLVGACHPAFQDGGSAPYDDFSMVLVDPDNLSSFRARVLLGGTSTNAEAHYQSLCRQEALPRRYVSLPDPGSALWTFPDSLPHVLLEAQGTPGFPQKKSLT